MLQQSESITSRMKKGAVRRNLIQIRINDEDMEHVTNICAAHNIKPGTLAYEFFQFSLQSFLQEQQENIEESHKQEPKNDDQMHLPLESGGK